MTTSPAQEPIRAIQHEGTRYTLLGTAHVSNASAAEVQRLVATEDFDAIAVELCTSRYAAITQPDAWSRLDLFKLIREGKAGMVIANLVLGAYQQRLAEQLGVQPGVEMRVAIDAAKEAGLPLILIDREVGITLKRIYRGMSWWERISLPAGLVISLLSSERINEEEIEKLKEGDMLETVFAEFADRSRYLYVPLIEERDRYMAAKLREQAKTHHYHDVLVVIGAGHLKGLAKSLQNPPTEDDTRQRTALESVPPSSPWPRRIPWFVVALVMLGFVIGFLQSPQLGFSLVANWVLINGGLSALGAAIAGGHLLSILGAFFAAPLTSLNPTIGAGMVVAGIEITLRRPQVSDFSHLRNDITHLRGWWHNRIARTLLVFLFSTLGSAIGTYVAGFRILERLTT